MVYFTSFFLLNKPIFKTLAQKVLSYMLSLEHDADQ